MEKGKKKSIPLWGSVLLAVVAVIAVGVAVWAVLSRQVRPVLAPDQAPAQEPAAESIPGDSGEKLESPEGGGSVSLTYSRDVTIDLSDGTATLYFANPGRSNQDMVLQVVIRDNVIVQSGTLAPGNQVQSLTLLQDAAAMLSPGSYEGNFTVLYYDPDTGEKAMVNTEIPLTITVQE